MSAPLTSKHIKVESKKGIPDHCVFADRYSFEDLDGYRLIHFGRAGQARAYAAVSLSTQALADGATPLKGFVEKLGPARDGISYELRDLAPSNTLFPSDVMNVSHRGPEAELLFNSFSLHDLALAGVSAKTSKTEVTILSVPVLMVRCPLAMVQSLLMKLFMKSV